MTADLIVRAERIYTMDRKRPVVRAMAVSSGRVAAVGTPAQLRTWRGRHTEVVDAGKHVIVPGFTDCHVHLFAWSLMLDEVDLAGVSSMDTVMRKIRSKAARVPRGQWVVGHGFDKNACGGEFPTAGDLDALTGDRPACIFSRDWHNAWVNTAGLRIAGIGPKTPDPPGGRIERDPRGRPIGILMDTAMTLLGDVRGTHADTRVPRLWARACRAAHRYGITAVHSVDGIDAFDWFQRLAGAGRLGLRVRYALPHDQLATAESIRLRGALGDDQFRVSALKVFSDGALGSQTAWMYRAYPGRPEYYGIPVCVGPALRETLSRAAALDLPCWVHAIGDRAVHEVASAMATVPRAPSGKRLLHRIEHAQCVRPRTVKLMAKHKIIASVQPSHLCEDMPIADRYWRAAAKHAYPLRSLRSAGIVMAFGSDLPVETLNPHLGLYAAVTRKNRKGRPTEGWYSPQTVDRWTAMGGYTLNAARSVGESDRLGRLTPGYHADFAILSDDPFRCGDTDLPGLVSIATYVGGVRRFGN